MLLNKMGLKHFYEPTPKAMRKIGDTILLGTSGISSMIMGLPLSDNTKLWAVFIINAIGVAAKMLTNFFKEEKPDQN